MWSYVYTSVSMEASAQYQDHLPLSPPNFFEALILRLPDPSRPLTRMFHEHSLTSISPAVWLQVCATKPSTLCKT